MRLPGLPVLLLLLLLAAGCSGDQQADYCDTVQAHQRALSDVAASKDAGTLFGALDIYDDLREEAPRDIADDWDTVVGSLRRLEEVLADHGVDPSTYSADEPPAHLDEEGRKAIEAAARDVGSERTVAAMAAVEQHALDVCGTPLSR